MDLNLMDVAELLNVSESTLSRWVTEGKIPHYSLNQQVRFDRSEIESWVLDCKQGKKNFSPFSSTTQSTTKERLGTQQFSLFRAIHKGGVWSNVAGKTKEQVIRAATGPLAEELGLDAEVLTELLLDRERLMPTALSNGIGVPHAREPLFQETFDVVAVVFPEKPIVDYGALDHQPVHTLFILFACDDKRHLHLLAKLAYLSSRPEVVEFLKKRPSKIDLLEMVKSWECNLRLPSA